MGRPKLQLDEAKIKRLAKHQCSTREIAAVVGCDESTLRGRFPAEIASWRESGKTNLRDMQWCSACKGNVTMQIFLGKQFLGQSDKLQAELGEIGEVFDPTEAYAKSPALMERALQLERDIYDADQAVDPVATGQAGLPGVEIPAAHSEARREGDGTAVQPDDESAGSGDSSPAR